MGDQERPVLDQINLVVGDMGAMVEFYRRLGLEIGEEPAPWDLHHRSASMPDGIDLALDSQSFASIWSHGWPKERTGPVIGFRLPTREAADDTHGRLTTAGYASQQEPYDAFWGARYAVVQDPDGNAVGLMSPTDPARMSPPPDPA